jgi:hypothetical protein
MIALPLPPELERAHFIHGFDAVYTLNYFLEFSLPDELAILLYIALNKPSMHRSFAKIHKN